MTDAFMPDSNIVWDLTSNCNISKNGEIGFMSILLWQQQKSDWKGNRKPSQIYSTITEAEDNAFEFCYSLENKPALLRLDEYKLNLRLRFSNIPDFTEPILSPNKPPVE